MLLKIFSCQRSFVDVVVVSLSQKTGKIHCRRRESLTGNATLHLYPHFKPLQAMPGEDQQFFTFANVGIQPNISFVLGVVDYLSTEISTSKQKKFPLVTFVDSPGLVDGDMWVSNHLCWVFIFIYPGAIPLM